MPRAISKKKSVEYNAYPANAAGKRLYAIARFLRNSEGLPDEAADLERIAKMFFRDAKRPTKAEYEALYKEATVGAMFSRRGVRR